MVKSLRNGKSDQRNTQGVAPTGATPWTCSKKRDLANESQVVIAAGSIRDGGAAVNRDSHSGLVEDVTTIDVRIWADSVADRDRAADVAAAVDIGSRHGAAVAGRRCHAPVARAGGVGDLRGSGSNAENCCNGPRKNALPVLHLHLPSPGLPFPKGRNFWSRATS